MKKEEELVVERKEREWVVYNKTKGTKYTVRKTRGIHVKHDGNFTVLSAVDVWGCECQDYQYRKRLCKHIRAVIAEEEHDSKHNEIAREKTEDLMTFD